MNLRALPLAALLLAAALSGCGQPAATVATEDSFADRDVVVTDSLGAITGVVLDEAVTPIAKVVIAAGGQGVNKTATSDDKGRFVLDGLKPGTYFLRATHLLYETTQVSVDVQAGAAPDVTKVPMKAKFTSKPFHAQQKFDGFITCGYQASGLTAPCVTDYSTILCGGGCVPALHDTLVGIQGDKRALPTRVGQGWSTLVFEMQWEPNGQGTSDSMGMLVSYQQRTASEWFGVTDGASPLLLRFEVGEEHASEQGSAYPMVNASGQEDLLILGSIKASEGMPFGINVNQNFVIIQTDFYNAKPPTDWSFVAGDEFPF